MSVKRSKYAIVFVSEELETRFKKLDLGNRRIVFGHQLAGNSYTKYGAVGYFSNLGFKSFLKDSYTKYGVVGYFSNLGFEMFLKDLPRDCYSSYVYEFYANLVIVKPGVFVHLFVVKKILLTVSVLSSILGIENPSNVSVVTKMGPTELDGFTELDQLRVLRDFPGLVEYAPPTTYYYCLSNCSCFV